MKVGQKMRLGVLVTCLVAGSAWATVVAGVEVPERTNVGGKTLKLNGTGLQRQLFFNVYTAALYVEAPSKDARTVITSEQTKRIQLHLLRDLTAPQVRGALSAGLKRAVGPAKYAKMRPQVMKLLRGVRDVRAGDAITITYTPGVGTRLESVDGTHVTIPGHDFGKAIFSIWLGPNTDVPGLRASLLGR